MHFKDDPPRKRDAQKSIAIAGRSFGFPCGPSREAFQALQEEVRARGGGIDADLSPDTDVLVVGSRPGIGRLAEKGREAILRGELYWDRIGLLEFVTEAALKLALSASACGKARSGTTSVRARPGPTRPRIGCPKRVPQARAAPEASMQDLGCARSSTRLQTALSAPPQGIQELDRILVCSKTHAVSRRSPE